jgi:signal peptidase I
MANDPVPMPAQGVASPSYARQAADGKRIAAAAPRPAEQTQAGPKDAKREIVETVVFVVVLVLLLKAFVAEAFVIPTGSMATTLLGYQKWAECPMCHFRFPVNCSDQEEKQLNILGTTCPNCRFDINFHSADDPKCDSGDRVLVAKYLYDSGVVDPQRLNVVVFKYPQEPQKDFVAQNYIKRLIGLPGETIGIRYGKLYVLKPDYGLKYDDSAVPPKDRWQREWMHIDDPEAMALFQRKESPFEIVRKPPAKILALRRIVYDNDHPASDLTEFPRWVVQEGRWAPDGANGFEHPGPAGDQTEWIRYRHVLRGSGSNPELITDFLGYNAKHYAYGDHSEPARNWVGDLMVECEATIDKLEGEIVLEVSKGVDRFRARWNLAEGGACTISRVTGDKETELDRQPTSLKKPGTYQLRLANVDDRICVWVNGDLPFGDGRTYEPAARRGPTENDLQPASIGVRRGASVKVHHIKLWRDTYYTQAPAMDPRGADVNSARPPDDLSGDELQRWLDAKRELDSPRGWSDPQAWAPLRNLPSKTLYVQPGHYLCLGDNSPESSDGRSWGLVPFRLMLGRALMVYWPVGRAGTIK